MKIISHTVQGVEIAEILSEEIFIQKTEDALDLLGNIYYQGFDGMILHQKNLTPEFFDLSTKMAGEILQKFSNYQMRLVIIGDFERLESKSLRDFITESNRGRLINFSDTIENALLTLQKTNGL